MASAAGARGRLRQAYLLFGTRVALQATRLAWAPLLVYISKELKLGYQEQGQVLSSFSFGYLFTQVLGGMAADRYGGKPVQTLGLVASALGMLLIPVVVDYGYWMLCSVYFVMGVCQGPGHPGYNAMAAIWFRASERGWVSSVCEAGPVCGTLLSVLIAPQLAKYYGWRTAFTVFGMLCTLWSIVWQHYAYSNPSEMPFEESSPEVDEEGGNLLSKAVGSLAKVQKSLAGKKFHMKDPTSTTHERVVHARPVSPEAGSPPEQTKTVARGPTTFPFTFFTFVPVWGVIGQHMIFNTTRYFFADWTPMYYKDVFGLEPDNSGHLLTTPFVAGAIVQMLMSGVEEPLIKSGYSPVQVRKLMGGCGFSITAVSLMMMGLTTNAYSFCFWLSILEASLACHACGYKANYMDLTTRYQGIFMGTGNTIASICTFGMPLFVAEALRKYKDWNGVLMALSMLNFVGIMVNQRFTVVKELHVAEI
mmetsp:Transcript_28543/g.55546  ORF Transcript_28543/g.55546 Transcript_28543/m.55546 type:complete len:476 (-) Transcript_28543:249-1676(-)